MYYLRSLLSRYEMRDAYRWQKGFRSHGQQINPLLDYQNTTALYYKKRRLLTLLKEMTLKDLLCYFSDSVVLEIHIQFLEVFLQPLFLDK